MPEINCTIFMYDQDKCETVVFHVPMPTSQDEVWMHILAKAVNVPDLRIDEVERVKDELGDDIMDYNIVAVIPGIHNCLYDTLSASAWMPSTSPVVVN